MKKLQLQLISLYDKSFYYNFMKIYSFFVLKLKSWTLLVWSQPKNITLL